MLKSNRCLTPSEDYDFVFWIDADAAFYDQERRIEDVLDLEVG